MSHENLNGFHFVSVKFVQETLNVQKARYETTTLQRDFPITGYFPEHPSEAKYAYVNLTEVQERTPQRVQDLLKRFPDKQPITGISGKTEFPVPLLEGEASLIR